MFSFVPLITLAVYGYKTYRNLQQVYPVHHRSNTAAALNQQTHRRQRRDNQLSRMLIPQILLFICQTTTFFTINLCITVTYGLQKSDIQRAIENLFQAIIFVLYETYPCIIFYIYYTQSKTFRAKVKKLLIMDRRGRGHGTVRLTNVAAVFTYNSGGRITMPAGRYQNHYLEDVA